MVYTYSDLKTAVNGEVHRKIENLVDVRKILNRGVRETINELDLRTTKRKSSLTPNLFDEVYSYSAPADLKRLSIIDIRPQINRSLNSELFLVPDEEFDRTKSQEKNIIALSDESGLRKLKINIEIDDDQLLISRMDSLTDGGGNWEGFGDGENLTQDKDNFVKGNASINFDISAAGGTTAGIKNTNLNIFDITDYVSAGSVLAWHYITDITNLTNLIVRIGNDDSNHFTKTITTDHAGNAFVNGWNLLRFDLFTATEVGTVDKENCNYIALYMTKDVAKVSETDYRFDNLILKRGKIHEIIYYSKYAWQTTAGSWIENSTQDSDLLNVDTDEFDLIVTKCGQLATQELEMYSDRDRLRNKFIEDSRNYKISNPSEAKLLTQTYYNI